jgi:hypothetical protein
MGAFAAALATAITVTPVLLAWTPEDCGPSDGANAAPGPRKYCENLRKRLIASDPGHYIMGKLENAPSIDGEPNSQHYYWINKMDNSSPTYFDGQSSIGQRILKVCTVGRLCELKIGIEKTWEHNLDHATFWISKLVAVKQINNEPNQKQIDSASEQTRFGQYLMNYWQLAKDRRLLWWYYQGEVDSGVFVGIKFTCENEQESKQTPNLFLIVSGMMPRKQLGAFDLPYFFGPVLA